MYNWPYCQLGDTGRLDWKPLTDSPSLSPRVVLMVPIG